MHTDASRPVLRQAASTPHRPGSPAMPAAGLLPGTDPGCPLRSFGTGRPARAEMPSQFQRPHERSRREGARVCSLGTDDSQMKATADQARTVVEAMEQFVDRFPKRKNGKSE